MTPRQDRTTRAARALARINGVGRRRLACASCGVGADADHFVTLSQHEHPVCDACWDHPKGWLISRGTIPEFKVPGTDANGRPQLYEVRPRIDYADMQCEPLYRCAAILALPEPDHALLRVLRGSEQDSPSWSGNTVHVQRDGAVLGEMTTETQPWAFVDVEALREAYQRASNPPAVLGAPAPGYCAVCRRTESPRLVQWTTHPGLGLVCAPCQHAAIEAEPIGWTALAIRVADVVGAAAVVRSSIVDWPGVLPPNGYTSPEPLGWLDRDRLIAALQAEELKAHRENNSRPNVARVTR